jgi:hypothetical protein
MSKAHFFVKREPPYPEPVKKPLRDLTEIEKAKVAENREMVRMHMPELGPMLKELNDLGMMDGWRSVGEVILHTKGVLNE